MSTSITSLHPSWYSYSLGSSSRGPTSSPFQAVEDIPRPPSWCIVNGLRRNTPIIFRISFEACVARKGTSVGGVWHLSYVAVDGDDSRNSLIKPSSESFGSIFTDGSEVLGREGLPLESKSPMEYNPRPQAESEDSSGAEGGRE